MGVWSYLLKRLVQVPLVILFVTIIIFALMKATPGDPISIMLGPYATPETTAALKAQYHLDQPFVVQYLEWVWDLLHGDLGSSIRSKERVVDMLAARLPVSLTLAGVATLISVIIAIPPVSSPPTARIRGGTIR
jgi:peptide/nickel transport system permease protein